VWVFKMAPKGEDILKGFQVYPFFAVVVSDFCRNVVSVRFWIKLYVVWYMFTCPVMSEVRLVSSHLCTISVLTIHTETG